MVSNVTPSHAMISFKMDWGTVKRIFPKDGNKLLATPLTALTLITLW